MSGGRCPIVTSRTTRPDPGARRMPMNSWRVTDEPGSASTDRVAYPQGSSYFRNNQQGRYGRHKEARHEAGQGGRERETSFAQNGKRAGGRRRGHKHQAAGHRPDRAYEDPFRAGDDSASHGRRREGGDNRLEL